MPHAPVSPRLRTNARCMRKALTDAELKLWNTLRAHHLIVEVDGSQHGNGHDLAYDATRTRRLQQDGWTVLRFWNDDVLTDIDNVCLHILKTVGEA